MIPLRKEVRSSKKGIQKKVNTKTKQFGHTIFERFTEQT